MVGCIAKAGGDEIVLNEVEMEEARWVSREGERVCLRGGRGATGEVTGRHSMRGAANPCMHWACVGPAGRRARPPPTPLHTHAPTDVRRLVADSARPDNPYAGGGGRPAPGIDFFVPPPQAIAHHLLRVWVEHPGLSWFGERAGGAGGRASHL